jgi:uncharacterized protein (TIGR03000 family)
LERILVVGAGLGLHLFAGLVAAEPPGYMGPIHVGEPNAYTRSIPGSFNVRVIINDYGPDPEEYYHWPTARQALDEYGWFGLRAHKSSSRLGPAADWLPRSQPAPALTVPANSTVSGAEIEVRVPGNASLWFDEHLTSQTGTNRRFSTGALPSQHVYEYRVRARWTADGKDIDRTRAVQFKAGERLVVDFLVQDSVPNR